MPELIFGTKTEGITIIAAVVFVLFFVLFCSFCERKHMKSVIICTVLSALGNAVIVVLSQPSDEPRYLWPSCILLLFTFIYMFSSLAVAIMEKDGTQKRKRVIHCFSILVILVLLGTNIIRSCNFENISYLKNRTEKEWQAIKENSDCPWLVFYDGSVDGWQFLCSEYDFQLPDQIRRVPADADAPFDPVLSESKEIIVYTDDKKTDIDSCIDYIERSGNTTSDAYEKISTSCLLNVYKVYFND